MDGSKEVARYQPHAGAPVEQPPAQPAGSEDIGAREAWNTILRNRLLIVSCTLIVVLGVGVFTYFSTPIYQSLASIRVEEKSSQLRDLDFLTGGERGNTVSTEMEVLRSRALAADVTDSLRLQLTLVKPQRVARDSLISGINASHEAPRAEILASRRPDGRFQVTNSVTKKSYGAFKIGQPVAVDGARFTFLRAASAFAEIRFELKPFRNAVDEMRFALTVARPNKEANVVTLRFLSSDPGLSRDVPNAVASRFIALRKTVQKTESHSTAKFLRDQLDTLSLQLATSENELQSFREKDQVVSLDAEAKAQVDELSRLQAQRYDIEAQRTALSSLLADVQAKADRLAPGDPSPYRRLLAYPTLLANPASGQYLTSLIKLEDDRSALLGRRMPADPDVMVLTNRIAELEQQIVALTRTYLDGLTSQAASLDGILAKFGKELERIPAKQVAFARLERRPKVLEGIFTLLQQRLKETEISEAVEDPSVRIIDEAILPAAPIKPRPRLNLAIALVAGLVLGIAAAFVRDQMDHSVHTREDVQRITGVPVLGLIPRIHSAQIGKAGRQRLTRAQKEGEGLRIASGTQPKSGSRTVIESRIVTGIDPRNPVSEAYRGMRTNITFARPDGRAKMLVFTSPMPGDGKTTSAANLAVTLVQQGLRVLLIDADMRRGVLNTVFSTPREPGLSNVLFGVATLEDAVRHVDLGENGTLDFLSTGTLPPNPAELVGSKRMRTLLDRLEALYDMVIFDSPPLNLVTDAAILGTQVDGVLLVARAGMTADGALAFAMEQLRNVRANVLGAVLNDVDFRRDVKYYNSYGSYGYSYYQYYYGHDKKAV